MKAMARRSISGRYVLLILILMNEPSVEASDSSAPSLNTPESPASAIVGSSTSIDRPASPIALGTSLLNGFDTSGNFKTGVAVEAAPFLLFNYLLPEHAWITRDSYGASYGQRLLSRTSFSLATAKGASNSDKSVALGIGGRIVLLDAGDPVKDAGLGDCFETAIAKGKELNDAVTKVIPSLPAGEEQPGTTAGEAVFQAAYAKCRTHASDRYWNRSAWSLSSAVSFNSPEGSYKSVSEQTVDVETSFAYGFDGLSSIDEDRYKTASGLGGWLMRNAQVIVGLKYANGQVVADPNNKGSFYSQNSYGGGGAFRFRFVPLQHDQHAVDSDFSFKNTLGSVAVFYASTYPQGSAHANNLNITISSEFKIGDKTYIDLGIGDARADQGGKNSGFALTQLKYNLASASSLFK